MWCYVLAIHITATECMIWLQLGIVRNKGAILNSMDINIITNHFLVEWSIVIIIFLPLLKIYNSSKLLFQKAPNFLQIAPIVDTSLTFGTLSCVHVTAP